MALSGRPVQGGGVEFAASGVHFGAFVDEEVHDFFAIVDGGPVEEGDGFAVSLVDIVASVDELFNASECSILMEKDAKKLLQFGIIYNREALWQHLIRKSSLNNCFFLFKITLQS